MIHSTKLTNSNKISSIKFFKIKNKYKSKCVNNLDHLNNNQKLDHLNNNQKLDHRNNHLINNHLYSSINLLKTKSNLMSFKRCSLLLILLNVLLVNANEHFQDDLNDEKTFLNEFAVELDSSTCPIDNCKSHLDEKANRLAEKHGFINQGQIGQLDGHYLFRHHQVAKRSTEYANHHHNLLDKEAEVLWVEQQEIKIRKKRDNEKTSYRFKDNMPDPLFNDQWYIVKGAKGGYDMNVEKAWSLGYTGKGVVVTILDDGIQPNHPDLELNYDPMASYDINDDDNDPTPQDNGDNKHGTRCAGEVASQAYNDICGVGIAFNASIGGVRMLDGTVTDSVEAKALSLNSQHIDIYSASWGPEDNGKTVDGPGRLAKRAFFDGINKGRKGLGSIYVWASGNGGRRSDNCNCDGYTNSVYTLSISSATQAGTKPWYLEECSSTLATTYSSGTPGKDVDMDTSYFKSLAKNKWENTSRLCTKSHTGTSASAPIAAGMCALALEANNNLTWRDMQHLVVLTSRYEPLQYESGWQINAVGRRYSHKFGYGLMDGEALVRHAEKWKTVPKQQICETRIHETKAEIPRFKDKYVETSIISLACNQEKLNELLLGNSTQESIEHNITGEQGNPINYLEHVQAKITLKFRPRGSLKITIISPSNTKSDLLLPRIRDNVDDSFNNWPFLSVHFWGEKPIGKWRLRITNTENDEEINGYLLNWGLIFYGTYESPEYPQLNQSKLSRRQFADNIDKKSVGIDKEIDNNYLQQQQQKSINKNYMSLPVHQTMNSHLIESNSVLTVLLIMFIVLFIFIVIILQMSYRPENIFKNHNYRRLNQLDDEEKLLSVNSEEISLETRKCENQIA